VKAKISLVAAVARNGVIGAGNGLPWRLSTDMKRFRSLTVGKPVVMGRKTFQSIGKALAERRNIVLTRQAGFRAEGVQTAGSLAAATALAAAADEIMVIGGGEIFAASIADADTLYITHVEAEPPGDAWFPAIDPAIWRAVSAEEVPAGPRDSAATRFVVYRRAAPARG
jgi:dihydrofolate reductase